MISPQGFSLSEIDHQFYYVAHYLIRFRFHILAERPDALHGYAHKQIMAHVGGRKRNLSIGLTLFEIKKRHNYD